VNGPTQRISSQPSGTRNAWRTLTVNTTLSNNAGRSIQFSGTGGDPGNIDQITIP
jgi:hypothetical protein